tara:strand:+ start:295 stop:453 length:159 start_codon:yes stop_codon:yes gene_type:complete
MNNQEIMANMESQISRLKAALALQAEANKALTEQRNEAMSSLANLLLDVGKE